MNNWILLVVMVMLHTGLSYNFSDYLVEFHKSYPTAQELAVRQSYFEQNYSIILSINSENLGYTLKVTEMTDWTQAEVNAKLGLRASDNVSLEGFSRSEPRKLRGTNNASVDWRTNGKVTEVKDQGSCGSCWAFTSTALFESFLAQTEDQLLDLSEEYLIECTPGSDCGGGYLSEALNLISSSGLPQESQYPYLSYYLSSGYLYTSGICSASGKQHDKPYTKFGYNDLTDEDMRTYLNIGPIGVGMYAESTFSFYSSGNYRCSQTHTSLNHAVMLVGYDTNNNWIAKNSWGKQWGISGFGYIASGTCGIGREVYRLFMGRVVPLVWIGLAVMLLGAM